MVLGTYLITYRTEDGEEEVIEVRAYSRAQALLFASEVTQGCTILLVECTVRC